MNVQPARFSKAPVEQNLGGLVRELKNGQRYSGINNEQTANS